MSDVYRICSQCGKRMNEIDHRFCPDCGADSHADLSVPESSLAIAATKAALPILVGTVSLALRFGLKLLQSRAAISAAQNASTLSRFSASLATNNASTLSTDSGSGKSNISKQGRRRIHIRTAWSMGDSNGNWRKGQSEHIIDIDE